jgi:hypothetical protein
MKLLTSRNGSFLTGDDIADAVLHYGLALTRRRELDVVDIPFVATDGAVHRAQFTVGWMFDTAAISDAEPSDELIDSDTARSLRAKADMVGVVHATAFDQDELEHLISMQVDPLEAY